MTWYDGLDSDSFWDQFKDFSPVYMQVGYFPDAEFNDTERNRITALCEDLSQRLRGRGLHPAGFEFRGNNEYHSAFVYLTDDQPNWERVEQIINTVSKEAMAVFGEDTSHRFRHRFWTY